MSVIDFSPALDDDKNRRSPPVSKKNQRKVTPERWVFLSHKRGRAAWSIPAKEAMVGDNSAKGAHL